MTETPNDISGLLDSWETTYKRGLLSFWLLLLLEEQPAYAYEISGMLHEASRETMSVNDQSIYRALSRFEDMGLVETIMQPSDIGPSRKYYHLTGEGRQLLSRFIERNLLVFQSPEMVKRFQSLTKTEVTEETKS
jgi:DNA-binding PadR family transcriptional regulator